MIDNSVEYSINGVSFSANKAFVSQSFGLLDNPSRKPVTSYSWPEYDGVEYDLAAKPRYQERNITLQMFFIGENWEELKCSFKMIMNEFNKIGTQRLVVEPFMYNPLVFDVVLFDSVSLEKTFSEGKMYGLCTLNLVEPNPMKRTFRIVGNKINIKYDAEESTALKIDNDEYNFSGNVDESYSLSPEIHYFTITGDISNVVTNAQEI